MPVNSCLFLNFPIFSRKAILRIIMTDQILILKEVAAYLKLTEKTVHRLAAEKKLPGFKLGGSWQFRIADLEAWIEEKKDKE